LPAIDHPFAVALNLVQPNEIALGYRFIYNSWGKGYATESCQILVDQGFSEWRVKRVIAWALVANKGSIRVMEKLGLTLEKQFRFSQHQLPYFSFEERQAVKYSRSRSEIPPETGFFR
jgi:RimJ/RimL family protein N-acetyltransferase